MGGKGTETAKLRDAMVEGMLAGHHPLSMALSIAVPMAISELVAQNGPTDADWQYLAECADLFTEKADVMLMGGEKKGVAAELFVKLVRALAIMAFVPGGIHLFGQHYWAMTAAPEAAQERGV